MKPILNYDDTNPDKIGVFDGDRKMGEIVKLPDDRWQYWPRGKEVLADPDDIFDTVEEVKERIG